MAQSVLENAPDSFALAGLSMGGILAFEIWRQSPERVTHLALIDTNPYADTEQKRQTRLEQIQIAMQGGLREMAIESLKPMYLAEANRDNEEILNTLLDMALDLGPDVFQRQSVALRERANSVATLKTIDRPAAVICGEEDRLCPVELHELMADQIPDATLTVVKDCGHLATLEQPAVVNQVLADLLAK
ncbi:MAG: alpha/beta hydrolase [Woeseiaceae bacterium]|nr:alpha/beta hydrolase [Woeseiaceae bacterium]